MSPLSADRDAEARNLAVVLFLWFLVPEVNVCVDGWMDEWMDFCGGWVSIIYTKWLTPSKSPKHFAGVNYI